MRFQKVAAAIVLVLTIALAPSFCMCSDIAPDSQEPTIKEKVFGLAILETCLIGFSGFAAWSPEYTGGILLASSPLSLISGTEGDDPWVNYLTMGVMGSIGAYNAFVLSDDKFSNSEVFWQNMAIWHGFIGAALLIDKFVLDEPTDDTTAKFSENVRIDVGVGKGSFIVGLTGRF